MIKAAALICKLVDGSLVPVASESVSPLVAMAKACRVSGELDMGGHVVKVSRGVVIASNSMGPVYSFITEKKAGAPAEVAADAPSPEVAATEPAKVAPRKSKG
jgi:hypothetical protein